MSLDVLRAITARRGKRVAMSVCSLAVGYPDLQAPVNAFIFERASVAEYTRWLE